MVLGLNLDNGEHFERALAEVTIPLQKEDLFFFYTDGISEAMDRNGECFGEAKLSKFLEGHADLPSQRIGDLLFAEVEAFAGGQLQHDDITMIILKVE
jgi:phosphoserine phosphatase RsbU/P